MDGQIGGIPFFTSLELHISLGMALIDSIRQLARDYALLMLHHPPAGFVDQYLGQDMVLRSLSLDMLTLYLWCSSVPMLAGALL